MNEEDVYKSKSFWMKKTILQVKSFHKDKRKNKNLVDQIRDPIK